ncbi:MAG: hypothetical protein ACRDCG_00190 [Mycoplasmoidaceae bacterium]
MKTKLFIDGVSNRLVIGIINNNIIYKYIKINKNIVNILVHEIDNILKENAVDKSDISDIYIINGPGNFSSLRISCVFANTFSLLSNCQLFVLNSCQFQINNKMQLSIIDAKSNLFYVLWKNNIKLMNMDEINLISNKNKMIILNDYQNYDFQKSWNYNKNKFKKVELVKINYIKQPV